MTNPNNAIGTPSGYGGRTSVFAYNALAQGYTAGVVSGFGATAGTSAVLLGGSATEKDVAIAVNTYGEKAIIVNTTTSAISVSLPSPSSTEQWASIVAYISSDAPTSSAILDNTNACGIIAVVGTGSAYPTDSQIRTAIASDGGDSLKSPYVVLTRAKYTSSSTTVVSGFGEKAMLGVKLVEDFTSQLSTPVAGGFNSANTFGRYYSDGTVIICAQVRSATVSAGAEVLAIPAQYAPTGSIYAPFMIGNNSGGLAYNGGTSSMYVGTAVSNSHIEMYLVYKKV